jgi:hypothetical protein
MANPSIQSMDERDEEYPGFAAKDSVASEPATNPFIRPAGTFSPWKGEKGKSGGQTGLMSDLVC